MDREGISEPNEVNLKFLFETLDSFPLIRRESGDYLEIGINEVIFYRANGSRYLEMSLEDYNDLLAWEETV